MQTPKTRAGFLEVPQRSSPATPRSNKQQKTAGPDSDSVRSPAARTPKARSPKIVDCRSPPSPASEQKKRSGRIADLENQLSQLQEELKKANDQLRSSESWKKQAQLDKEETKKQLDAMSVKLEESEQQIHELSVSEDSRDRAWLSEVEALQKHHSKKAAALASAMDDIEELEMQLVRVAESEAASARGAELAEHEVQSLRRELSETLYLVEDLKHQLTDCKESKAQASLEVVKEMESQLAMARSTEETLRSEGLKAMESQLAMARSTEETLRSEGLKAMEPYNSVAVELEQSKNQFIHLEGLVSKLQKEFASESSKSAADPSENFIVAQESDEHERSVEVEKELNNVKTEVGQLRSALEAAERRYQEEHIQSTLQIRSAYEVVEHTKLESSKREAELEANLETAKSDVEELKTKLMDKETNFHTISEENQGLHLKVMKNHLSGRESELEIEVKKFEQDLVELKASLLDKEIKLQSITEENEALKMEMEKRELEKDKANDETLELAEAARDAVREALMKLNYLTEEADKISRKTARVTEQLAARATNSKIEAELRRSKVHSDQWRKAAEAAVALLTTGNNGKIERSRSLDNYHTIGGKLSSPFSEDMDDDSP